MLRYKMPVCSAHRAAKQCAVQIAFIIIGFHHQQLEPSNDLGHSACPQKQREKA